MAQPSETKRLLKVINRKSNVKDVLSIDLRVLTDVLSKPENKKVFSESLQEDLRNAVIYFNKPEVQFLKLHQPISNIASILTRDILKSHMLYPIVTKREKEIKESDIDPNGESSVFVQLPYRTKGIYNGHEIYLAEGENVIITGFKHGPQSNIIKYLILHKSKYDNIFANKSSTFLYLKDEIQINTAESLKNILKYVKQVTKFYFTNVFSLLTKKQIVIDEKQNNKIKGNLSKFIETGIVEKPEWNKTQEYKIINMLLKKYVSIIGGELDTNWSFSLEPFTYLNLFGSFENYLTALDHGVDSDEMSLHFKNVKNNHERVVTSLQTKNKIFKNKTLALFYVKIMKNKLSAKRFNEIMTKISTDYKIKTYKTTGGIFGNTIYNIYNPKVVIDSVTKQEAKIIIKEYENIIENWKMTFNNKCEHLKLLKKLYKGKTRKESYDALTEIKQLIVKGKEHDWYNCKLCNMRLICPHVVDKIEQENIDFSHSKVKEILYKYIDFESDNKKAGKLCFCKICSEQLVDNREDNIQNTRTNYVIMDNDIRDKLYGALMSIIPSLRFTMVIDPKMLVSKGINLIYPHVFSVNNLNIAVIIYAYAYILDVVHENENINYESVKPGSKISMLANVLLKDLSKKYNQLIMRTPYATYDYVSEKFLEAYNAIKRKTKIDSSKVDDVSAIVTDIFQTPTYQYLTNILKRIGGTSLNKKTNVDDTVQEFNKVLGFTFNDLITESKITRKNNSYNMLFNGDSIVVDSGKTLEFLKKEKPVNLFKNMYDMKNITDQEKKFLNMSGTLQEMLLGELLNSYRLFRMYVVDRINYNNVDIYNVAMGKHREASNYIKNLLRKPKELYKTYDKYVLQPNIIVSLSDVYDEQGEKHKWDLYKFNDQFVKKKEIYNLRLTGKINSAFSDIKCSVCGLLKSETYKLNNDKIKSSLTDNAESDAMISYFSDLCPSDQKLHEWVDNSCKKCGIMSTFPNSAEKRKYYNKHKKIYLQESIQDKTIPEKVFVSEPKYDDSFAKQWKYDPTILNNMCQVMNVNMNLINSLGRMENRYIEDINNGSKVPDYPTEKDSRAIHALDSEIRNIKIELSKITHKKSHIKSEHNFTTLYKDYNLHYVEIRNNRDAKDIYLYCLETICDIVNKTNDIDPEVGKFILTKIIDNQKTFVKPGKFKFSIFYSDSSDFIDVEDRDEIKDADEVKSSNFIDDFIKEGQ